MIKVLLGVCSVGNGHVSRQRLIIKHLLEYNIDMTMVISQNNCDLFNSQYPNIKKIIVNRPWIVCNSMGIDFEATKEKYAEYSADLFDNFLDFSINVRKSFAGENPDYILTDYEPYVAQFAYATNVPLICLDQQSKLLNIPINTINGFSVNTENCLLNYFFPYAKKRYVSSFFKINNCRKYNIEVIPPIIKVIERKSIIKNKVVVYFSPYPSDLKDYIKILELIKNNQGYTFHIYTEHKFDNYNGYSNLKFKKFGDDFDDDLSDCNFIIATSGHQLISEAISLEIPLYLSPLATFEQNYCCYMVEKEKFGLRMRKYDQEEFERFIALISQYRNNMKKYKSLYWKKNWDEVLFEKLEVEMNISKNISNKSN